MKEDSLSSKPYHGFIVEPQTSIGYWSTGVFRVI